MTQPDQVITRITEAVQNGRPDDLAALWDELGPGGDPMHRCSVAHYLADMQKDPEAELLWDQRALAAVEDVPDSPFLPSLHTNLADVHRRLGAAEQAARHLQVAEDLVPVLPDDDYGRLIRVSIVKVRELLDAGSTAPLMR
jgi:hypothetical protein